MEATLIAKTFDANSRLVDTLLECKTSFSAVIVCGINQITIDERELTYVLPHLGKFYASHSDVRKAHWEIIVK